MLHFRFVFGDLLRSFEWFKRIYHALYAVGLIIFKVSTAFKLANGWIIKLSYQEQVRRHLYKKISAHFFIRQHHAVLYSLHPSSRHKSLGRKGGSTDELHQHNGPNAILNACGGSLPGSEVCKSSPDTPVEVKGEPKATLLSREFKILLAEPTVWS